MYSQKKKKKKFQEIFYNPAKNPKEKIVSFLIYYKNNNANQFQQISNSILKRNKNLKNLFPNSINMHIKAIIQITTETLEARSKILFPATTMNKE
jgi:hypothetical protein